MKFRTEYNARPCTELLNPELPVVLLGSCFTDYIGERMRKCRWDAYPNICGSLYNPKSIANILSIACSGTSFSHIVSDSIVERNPLWVSWLMDSKCVTYTQKETRDCIISKLNTLRSRLEESPLLIITFGTAWIYELRERPGYIVSNCHKFPSDMFLRRRLSVGEIVAEWEEIMELLKSAFPGLRVLFTVSPVRHLKDGFEENSLSKSILRLACDEICRMHDSTDYFPAYEIVNDDLRDYRFYSEDLVHPSKEAVEYIWEKFQERYLSPASRSLLAEGEKLTKRLNHHPIIPGKINPAQ